LLPGSPAAAMAHVPEGAEKTLSVVHPSGETTVIASVSDAGEVTSAAILRTARKLMDGVVFG
jgi:4-oxalomesaconate tautomerase